MRYSLNSLSFDLDSLSDDLGNIIYEVEQIEEENINLKEYIDVLESQKQIKTETIYDKLKESFLVEISEMYSLEELEKIFQKKQGYPLTKIK